MSTTTVRALETTEDDELVGVLRWRMSRLVQAGYALEEAVVLATHPEIDLHEAVRLLDRGCPPETAFRILV